MSKSEVCRDADVGVCDRVTGWQACASTNESESQFQVCVAGPIRRSKRKAGLDKQRCMKGLRAALKTIADERGGA